MISQGVRTLATVPDWLWGTYLRQSKVYTTVGRDKENLYLLFFFEQKNAMRYSKQSVANI